MDKLMTLIMVLACIGSICFTMIWALKIYWSFQYQGSVQQMLDRMQGRQARWGNKGFHFTMAVICISIVAVYFFG